MKKSQIMAVFALALALGAVAPIAGVVGSASAKVTTAQQKAINKCVNAYKDGFAAIRQYKKDGDVYKLDDPIEAGADSYTRTANFYANIFKVEDARIANLVKKNGAVTNAVSTAIYQAVTTQPGEDFVTGPNKIQDLIDLFADTDKWGSANVDFNTIVATGNEIIAILNDEMIGQTGTTKINLSNAIIGVQVAIGAINNPITEKNFVTVTRDTEVSNIVKNITNIALNYETYVGKDYVVPNTEAKAMTIYNELKAAFPDLNKYVSHIDDEAKLAKVANPALDGKNYSDAEIAAFTAPLCSTTPSTDPGTTDTPSDADNTDADVNAPNTGILSSAEGSATTISIVAGLTTALASLGAGVVAYRSARRGE